MFFFLVGWEGMKMPFGVGVDFSGFSLLFNARVRYFFVHSNLNFSKVQYMGSAR